ncbi:MAG: hypothetical protein RBS73_06755 [Prolixibacteraceae bacterium]|nr:hypothetical protein [Prolixibacteraceae bacterium]
MENKKYIIALILFIFAGLFAGAQNKFQITNLKIEHSVKEDGNIDARITFTYKQTEGYIDKVTPRLAVDGNAIISSYQGGFNGGALRLESNGVLNLRTGMEEMPKDLSTNTLISKLSDGQHTLSVKFEGYTSTSSNKFIAIDSNVATVSFVVGNSKQTETPPPVSNTTNQTFVNVETNNTTGVPYTGVTADGTSSIRINLSGISGDRVKFEIPYGMGFLKYKGGLQAINEPKIDQYISLSGGSATVFFHPPKYLAPDLLTSQTGIKERQVWCINAPIHFTYKDASGNIQNQIIKINVLRPVVFLVHGFTGDASTWASLSKHLTDQKFDCKAENYYALNDDWGLLKRQNVFAQSRKLSETIDLAKGEYAASGVKMLKVDVVSHSMGGLIARYYAHGYNDYRNDVRKLFMVGTPNHGIGDKKQLLGAIGAVTSWSHFGMLADVHEESAFMMNLNKDERTGGHLNPHVEYYNIFGTFDDGVTNASSAYMPGVLFTQIRKCCHSPSPGFLSALGAPLTVHPEVFTRVTEYLQKEIMRIQLKNVKAEIVQQRGEVLVDEGAGNRRMVLVTPSEVRPYDKIYTRENSSTTISFTMDGQEWGRLITGQNTSLQLKNYSPQMFTVRVVKGKARFRSNGTAKDGSHFQVEIVPDNYSKLEWYTFSPKVDINSIGTTFEVIYENGIAKINLIEGQLRLDDNEANEYNNISTPQTIAVSENGQMHTQPLQVDNELNQLDTGGPVKGGAEIKPGNPLFAHVTIGGTLANLRNKQQQSSAGGGSLNSCLGQLKVQFVQKTGAVNDPQARMIMMKIDDENKRELFWFNQAAENYKKGVFPREMSGTYRKQQSPGVANRSYFSETITLFEPMKITSPTGNSHGFMLMKDSREYKQFNTNQEAEGVVLPCGSYKVYPADDLPFATTKFQLVKTQ